MRRVLLVEDNPADADLLRHFLLRSRVQVDMVHVSTLAAAVAAEGDFDCALLDLSLPDSQGLATLHRFMLHRKLPVIVLTGLEQVDTGTEAIRVGADDYLEKGSISPASLRRVLEYSIERGRLRRRLEQSQRSFGAIVERSPNGIVVIQSGRVVFLNRRARELLPHLDVGEGFPHSVEGAYELSSGGLIIEIQASGTEWQDAPAQMVIARDVTTLRAEAERLRHRESELQKAQRVKALGRLAAGLAHEFNNGLTMVTGNAELLRKAFGPQADSLLDPLLAAAEHMRVLNAQILALSPQPVRELERVDVNGAVRLTRPLLERLLDDVALVLDLDPAADQAMFPPGELSRLLVELVGNASSASRSGDTVTVSTQRQGGFVEIRVSDTGDGMSEEVRQHALEPFFSARGQTGLGLTAAFGVVRGAGGELTLESAEGKGTTVRIRLPHIERVDLEEHSIHAGTILLVEDDPFVRALAEQILGRAGHFVVAAADGEEALLVEEVVDLIVTDMVMPGIGGAELYRQLVHGRPGLPAVFISGYSDSELPTEADGHSVFLQKPFRPKALLDAVQRLLPR